MHTANTMCLQSFWALLCICICLPSDVNAKKACDRRPWIPLAKYCPLWLQPFHLQLHFSDGRFFSPSWLPSHAWAIGCRSLNNLQSWRLPCETLRFTSFTSTIISWYHDCYSMPYPLYTIYTYIIYHLTPKNRQFSSFHSDFRTKKTIKEVKELPKPRSYCRRSPWQVLRLWRMHGELVPVELETGMLEVRKVIGTTEHARQCQSMS